MQETPARTKRQDRGCAAKHTPHPPGGEGWSLGPGGPRSTRSTQRECHKVPVLVCTPGQQHSAVPTLPSPGMRCPDTSGMRGKVAMGLGMLHLPGFPKSSLQPPRWHPQSRGAREELELCSMLGRQEEEDAQARLAPGACAEVALAGRRTLRIYRLTRAAGASQ